MRTLDKLDEWKQQGVITELQHSALAALVRKDRFSVFFELNALLYLGVLALVGGLGWTVTTYSANFGDAFIIAFLSALLAGALYYCFSWAPRYSRGEVESPPRCSGPTPSHARAWRPAAAREMPLKRQAPTTAIPMLVRLNPGTSRETRLRRSWPYVLTRGVNAPSGYTAPPRLRCAPSFAAPCS